MEPGQVVQPNDDDQQSTAEQPVAEPPRPDPAPPAPPVNPALSPPNEPVGTPPEATAPVPDADIAATPQQEQAPQTPTRSDQPQPTQPPDEPPADPPASTPPAPPANNDDQGATDSGSSLFSWEASEYVEHERTAVWYIVLAVAAAGIMTFLILVLKEWLSALVVVLMAAAIVVYARKRPRVLKYQLTPDGLTIDTKFYPYEQLRSFAVVAHGSMQTIELDPLKRFMPRLTIFFDPQDVDKVTSVLEERLPRNERTADPIDRLSHYLKF